MDNVNKLIDAYIIQFKKDIQSKMNVLELLTHQTSEAERDKFREWMEYVYEYPKLVLTKQDFISVKTKKSSSNMTALSVPLDKDQVCIAKRSDGAQCTRKKKKNCDYCGTHAKIEQMQAEKKQNADAEPSVQKMEISAEDIHGIIYYIDKYNNVYHTEDILEGIENPRIIAKAIKHGNNHYSIPDLFDK